MNFTLLQGDVRERLAELPDESVHCVVTSPPYWGLRDYKLEPQVWGAPKADSRFREVVEKVAAESTTMPEHLQSALTAVRAGGCEHEWGEQQQGKAFTGGIGTGIVGSHQDNRTHHSGTAGQFCLHCNAWRGSLGLEPTPDLFIEHLVSVFREVRRVLRKDGTCWLNLGDSYSSGGGAQVLQTKNASHGLEGMRAKTPGMAAKQLLGIPWRVALALQSDGWWLRSDIVWYKPNCMPGSQKDRPTTAHEYVFFLTKSARYFFDQEAVREPAICEGDTRHLRVDNTQAAREMKEGDGQYRGSRYRTGNPTSGRNIRSVWTIPTAPFCGEFCTGCRSYFDGREKNQLYTDKGPDGKRRRWCVCGRLHAWLSHFATFPPALVEPCVKAGTSERGCCPDCGAPRERVMEDSGEKIQQHWKPGSQQAIYDKSGHAKQKSKNSVLDTGYQRVMETRGWKPTCDHDAEPTPCTVLDPFAGAGTALLVALRFGRRAIGIELNPDYAEMARQRILADAPLLNKEGAP